MRRTKIDNDWEFMSGEPSGIPGMSGGTKTVNLPHDFMIEGDVRADSANGANTGYFDGGTGTYTKYIDAPPQWADKRILVDFDGVFGETKVILNGHVVGRHYYGYTPFRVDLTGKMMPGKRNRLAVVVSNDAEPNSRWYSGAGIYRHVHLLTAPNVHIAPCGIFAHTSHIVGEDAFVVVETKVENHTAEDKNVWVDLRFRKISGDAPAGNLTAPAATASVPAAPAAKGTVRVFVPAGGSAVARTQIMVEQAQIWDVDSPNLYEISAVLLQAVRREEIGGETAGGMAVPKETTESATEDNGLTEKPAVNGTAVCKAAVNGNAAAVPVDTTAGKALSYPHALEVLDEEHVNFGIRTISVDAKNGFMLNGRSLKLKGGCIHHDNGILGAASFQDSEYRKVKLHKDNGYNALRFAHNPVSSDMLDACDRLGILAIDEAFDTWNMSKNLHDFSSRFCREWEAELESLVTRDRNHPCVIIWSIGNELPEQGGLSEGYQTSAQLAAFVRKLDDTRFVAGALCSFFNGLDDEDTGRFWQSLMQEAQANGGALNNLDGKFGREIWNDYTETFAAPWDVVGYNYLNYHYDEAAELFPDRVICCTESKPGQMEEYWEDVLRLPNVIGDFEWTSHDYIGEAGIGKRIYAEPEQAAQAGKTLHMAPYPWRTAGAGEFDLCGFPKPQLAYRRILWGSEETYIACHNPANYGKTELIDRYGWPDCANSWTWPVEEGAPVRVEVYSAAEEVELWLNGHSIGREKAGKENHRKAAFELEYQRGTLEAVSYTEGQEISRDRIISAGTPAGLKITVEPGKAKASEDILAIPGERLPADGQSLAFVVVEVVDAAGNPVPYAETEITARVEGAATLAAFGTGRPATEENYTSGKITTYQGRSLAVLRAGLTEGRAKLIVKADGFPEEQMELQVVSAEG